MSAQCRTCGDVIVWCVTITGNRIPMNAEPVETGLFIIDRDKNPPLALYARTSDVQGERYSSHFAVCPDANQHRRKHIEGKKKVKP